MDTSLSNRDGYPVLYQRFLENARTAPTSLAIIDDTPGVATTYAALVADASRLAARLIDAEPHLLPGEPVCILMPRCFEQVWAKLSHPLTTTLLRLACLPG